MSLPSRYSGTGQRKHVHLRLTPDMWRDLVDDKGLYGSAPERIRMILLERYRAPRDKRFPSREGDKKNEHI